VEEKINEYEKVVETSDENKRQEYWNMAIGLNQVDNLTPSKYLIELVNENVNGKINIVQVEEKLNEYYKTKNLADKKLSNELECDLVSTRIVELLNDNSFVLNPISFKNIHKYLFKDIYDFAGSYRTYNITKDEPILNGDTVNYAPYHLIEDSLEYDFENEKKFDYSKLSMNDKIKHIVDFTSRIWQVHPFGER
jgi:fido (protein-threonine AMPylation protein)